jgi:F-type H+-transporting ATPase subunit a
MKLKRTIRPYQIALLALTLFLWISNPIFSSESEASEFNLNEVIVHHLSDAPVFPLNIGGSKVFEGQEGFNPNNPSIFHDAKGANYHYVGGFDLHITKRVTMMWIGCLILLLIFIPAARLIARNPMKVQSRFASAVEAIVGYVKDDVVEGSMHGHGHAYYHYMLTLFFFILSGNLMGIIPPIGEIFGTTFAILTGGDAHHSMASMVWSGITTTGDVSVTVSLALLTFALIMGTGFALPRNQIYSTFCTKWCSYFALAFDVAFRIYYITISKVFCSYSATFSQYDSWSRNYIGSSWIHF